jgi:hypothetical protein
MNYSTGHIYKIICRVDDTFCYIGSTFNTLRNRWQDYKHNYKCKSGNINLNCKFYKYGIDKFKMILIKDYLVYRENNSDHKQLKAYETLWINKSKSCINDLLPFNPLKNNRKKTSIYNLTLKKFIEDYTEKCDNGKISKVDLLKMYKEKTDNKSIIEDMKLLGYTYDRNKSSNKNRGVFIGLKYI